MHYGIEYTTRSILFIYLIVMGILAVIGLAAYIFQGIGMYTLGKKRGMQYPWLAFIPYARTYYQGELCGTLQFGKRSIKNPGIWMLVIPIVSNMIMGLSFGVLWITIVGRLASLAWEFGNSYSMQYQFPGPSGGFGNSIFIILIIMIGLLSIAVTAVQKTLTALVNHQIYSRYTDKNFAVLHAVLGVFVPLYTAVYFFIIRNRE